MNEPIYVDPMINLQSSETIEIIIEFKVEPATVAAKSKTGTSLKQARQMVEKSHANFREELKEWLEKNHLSYHITHIYKDAFNGVSMKMKGIYVNRLLRSTVIKAIYRNQEVHLPVKPTYPWYEL